MFETKSSGNWFWPTITTQEEAKSAARPGVWVAAIVAAITALIAAYAAATGKEVIGINAWAFVDAALFAGISFGIYKMSRAAAVVGLLLYLVERVYMTAVAGGRGAIVTILFTVALINSARGTFAFHKLAASPQPTPPVPPPIG